MPSPTACDDEHGDLFYPAGQQLGVFKCRERFLRDKMQLSGPGRQKLKQGRNSWQRAKHARLYSDLTLGIKGRTSQLWVINKADFDFCVRSTPTARQRDQGLGTHKQRWTQARDWMKRSSVSVMGDCGTGDNQVLNKTMPKFKAVS